MVFSFVFITFEPISVGFFEVLEKNPEIQDGGSRWPPFRNDYQLLRHVTSSPHDVDVISVNKTANTREGTDGQK